MKRYSTLLILVCITLLGMPLQAQKKNKKNKFRSELPDEWLFNQRAYPYGEINKQAISKASKQTKLAVEKSAMKMNVNWELVGEENVGRRITNIQNDSGSEIYTYNVTVEELDPYMFFWGNQDEKTWSFTKKISPVEGIVGSDGFQVYVDPSDQNVIYPEYQYGYLFKSINGGIDVEMSMEGIDKNDRKNWSTPFVISPIDNNVLYYGSHRLYKSVNGAISWELISEDLTNGPVSASGFSYGTLTAIGASYNNLDVIYTGSDDGRMHVTTDGGESWLNIDSQLPNRNISSITVDEQDDMTVYVTLSGYSGEEKIDQVYKSVDGGINWVGISSALPDLPINDLVIYEKEDKRLLIIANDMGVWYSDNEGRSWNVVGENHPMDLVTELRIDKLSNTLYAGSFGNSIYSYDVNDLVTGIDDLIQEGENVFAYPIPVNDILFIKVDGPIDFKTSGVLTDMRGNIIANMYPSFESYTKMSFDVSQVSSGTYLLELKSNKKYKTVRIVVKH